MKVAIPQQTLSLLYKTKGKPDWIQKNHIQLLEELFSSLREAGSWQGSASNLIVLSSRQTKVAISGNQLSSLINLLYLKKKNKNKRGQEMENNTPHLNPPAEAGRMSLKCIFEKQWKRRKTQ